MRDKLRKRYQHKINRLVKDLNKSIEEDNLWNGRFVFHIIDTDFERFSDNSGGMLYVVIRGYDKKTDFYRDYTMGYAPYLELSKSTLWEIANKFITEDTDTWKNGNNPYNDKEIDYIKIKMNEDIWNLKKYPSNYFAIF